MRNFVSEPLFNQADGTIDSLTRPDMIFFI